MSIITGTAENFNQVVLQAKGSIIVDFWAAWCGHCTNMLPIVEAVIADHPDVTLVKVNVDEQPLLAMKYNVNVIPTLLFVKDGEIKHTAVGDQTKEYLESLL